MMAVVSRLKDAAKGFLKARDRFWSGVWWTEWQIRRNERRLADALEEFGEDSMPVRQLTERHRKLVKGARYWRPSDPVVIRVLEASERAGASRSDLRVLALNRDFVRVGDKVQVRRGWGYMLLAMSALGIFLAIWLMLMVQVVSSPARWEVRAAVAGGLTFFLWLIWPGWGLYTTRALDAAVKSGETVGRTGEQQKIGSASVTSIEVRRR
ncbi:MAG: hypothetical protein H3C29_14330 [Simplicispira suum]|uniref:hypothetical protein n=1 Tax=Simplicispira suum TaxID=2109915 RepID=UPI001C6CAF1D|nr:hypothetical protein [Simplicispira suum]MBW7834379.1 hypothetical protein [Simplicispira suum]